MSNYTYKASHEREEMTGRWSRCRCRWSRRGGSSDERPLGCLLETWSPTPVQASTSPTLVRRHRSPSIHCTTNGGTARTSEWMEEVASSPSSTGRFFYRGKVLTTHVPICTTPGISRYETDGAYAHRKYTDMIIPLRGWRGSLGVGAVELKQMTSKKKNNP